MTLNTIINTNSSLKQRQQQETYHRDNIVFSKVKEKSQKQKYQLQTYFYTYEK